MKRFWLGIFCLFTYGLLASCAETRVILQTAPSKAKGPKATPELALTTKEHWENVQAPEVARSFETYLYGVFPKNFSLSRSASKRLDGTYFDDTAFIDIETLTLTNRVTSASQSFGLVIIRPAHNLKAVSAQTSTTDTPITDTPIIMTENFCPNHSVVPVAGIPVPKGLNQSSCSSGGFMGSLINYFFGRYITTPPVADIMRRGYSLAVIHPPEYVPDDSARGELALQNLYSDQDPATQTRAIMAWAHQFSALSRHLKTTHNFSKTIAFGHSRYGKAALIAAAYDKSIDSVIAHQSGTGGASLSKDHVGESIANITESYPHWFSRNLTNYAQTPSDLPFDQHHLLALNAPRPVLLGNAKRDVWSDPNGAFRAAQAASAAYRLYGSDGLTQSALTKFDPKADLAFWMRPGTHGVVKEDWPAFLDFLDAHSTQ